MFSPIETRRGGNSASGPNVVLDSGEQWPWAAEWTHHARAALARAKGAS